MKGVENRLLIVNGEFEAFSMFLQILSPIKKAITRREKLTKYDVPRCVKTVILLPLKVEEERMLRVR